MELTLKLLLQSLALGSLVLCTFQAGAAESTGDLAWSTDSAQPSRFLAVHGQRSAVLGYSEEGLEAWAYPFQVLRALTVSFRPLDGASNIDGRGLLKRVIYRPESVTRIYVGPDFVVRERVFVPLDRAGAVISYEVDGRPVEILVHFIPVLDLMWPAGTGGQETLWDDGARAYRLIEPTHRFAAVIGSPDMVGHDDTQNYAQSVGRGGGLTFTVRAGSPAKIARVVIAGAVGGADPAPVASAILADESELEDAASKHYADLLRDSLQIETPDPQVNRALSWAQVALEQAWVCNPDLGCGFVAGYGASRKARRPQYDWFFAGDGMVAVGGMLATGRFERAREELEFILKYRNRGSGMIWHEMTQSAAYLDWDHYPYKFVHVDLTFDFLQTMNRYLTASGDQDFVKRNWDAVDTAYRYCRSLLDPKDGLPRIPAGKQGMNEQDVLTDDLSLSASWVAAAEAFAELAAATGHAAQASQARRAAQEARVAANGRYWDSHQNTWISAYNSAGKPLTDPDAQPVAALRSSLFSTQQRDSLLEQLASAALQADWGTRSKSANSPNYRPNSYGSGSVWGLGSSGTASAFWDAHRPATAFPIWNALVSWMALDSLGHMPETLAGDFYHEELESVPEQTWSSAAFLSATVNGLLGLQVQGGTQHVNFAPHLPASWDGVSVKHLRVGSSVLSAQLIRTDERVELQLDNVGAPVEMTFEPELPLGSAVRDTRFNEQAVTAVLVQNLEDTHARVQLRVPTGHSSLLLHFSGGVRVTASTNPPEVGDPSSADKLVGVTLRDRALTIELDHLASTSSNLEVCTPWTVTTIDGAVLESRQGVRYRLRVNARDGHEGGDGYRRQKVIMKFADSTSAVPPS